MNSICKCGNDIDNPKVYHKSEYSKWGWFLFTILGLSAKPTSVSFICSICEEIILVTKDKDVLKKYVGR